MKLVIEVPYSDNRVYGEENGCLVLVEGKTLKSEPYRGRDDLYMFVHLRAHKVTILTNPNSPIARTIANKEHNYNISKFYWRHAEPRDVARFKKEGLL